jgi:N-acetylneuraminate synthase
MNHHLRINRRIIGPEYPIYIIAEVSANHHQDFEQTVQILHAAKQAGADAIKLQTYTPDTLTIQSDRPEFLIQGGTLWDQKKLYDLYREGSMPWEWQPKLQSIANDLGIDFFSTAFDPSAVDFLENMNVPVHKIASFELVDIPLIEYMAKTGKPLIISTGMATLEEIEEAVKAARNAGTKEIALLKCTSAYPAPPEEMNLRTISRLQEVFQLPIGISDHTTGIVVPIASVVMGACIIEKHFTLSRSISGPDSAFSLEPDEFQAMVEAIRVAEKAIGTVHYGAEEQEAKSRIFRRSLYVIKDMKTGECFSLENIRSIRPASGLHPRYLKEIISRRAKQDIKKGTPLSWELID